jgi:hypothetical protein
MGAGGGAVELGESEGEVLFRTEPMCIGGSRVSTWDGVGEWEGAVEVGEGKWEGAVEVGE